MTEATSARSRNMAAIRGKDTKPEVVLRRALFASGFRYRLHVRRLPGSPDLVFSKYRAVLFVHGCFWHRHEGCKYTTMPRSNEEFWRFKFQNNVGRDARNVDLLRDAGWRVGIVWECALKRSVPETIDAISLWLLGLQDTLTVG